MVQNFNHNVKLKSMFHLHIVLRTKQSAPLSEDAMISEKIEYKSNWHGSSFKIMQKIKQIYRSNKIQ